MSTAELLARIAEIAEAGDVRSGDEILLGHIGVHLVAEVNRYPTLGMRDEECVVIVYFTHEEHSFENRARDRRGHASKRRLVLKQLKPLKPTDRVLVIRGSAGAADTMRERLERDQDERWASQIERRDRAIAAEEARRA